MPCVPLAPQPTATSAMCRPANHPAPSETRTAQDDGAPTGLDGAPPVASHSVRRITDAGRPRDRRTLVPLLGVFAEFEHEAITDRVIDGMTTEVGKGKWSGGCRPYGYHAVIVRRTARNSLPRPQRPYARNWLLLASGWSATRPRRPGLGSGR
jgi:hypothetical protein